MSKIIGGVLIAGGSLALGYIVGVMMTSLSMQNEETKKAVKDIFDKWVESENTNNNAEDGA